jgi:hypothetical protein
MWWVWDQPKQPAGISVSEFTGAYMAWGTGGQFIVVLPWLDMVVAHKVENRGRCRRRHAALRTEHDSPNGHRHALQESLQIELGVI